MFRGEVYKSPKEFTEVFNTWIERFAQGFREIERVEISRRHFVILHFLNTSLNFRISVDFQKLDFTISEYYFWWPRRTQIPLEELLQSSIPDEHLSVEWETELRICRELLKVNCWIGDEYFAYGQQISEESSQLAEALGMTVVRGFGSSFECVLPNVDLPYYKLVLPKEIGQPYIKEYSRTNIDEESKLQEHRRIVDVWRLCLRLLNTE